MDQRGWEGGAAALSPNLGHLDFWAEREIWARQIFKEVCMYVCVLLFSF